LDHSQKVKASATISALPLEYRRALMGALTPNERAEVWQGVVQSYITHTPNLNAAQVEALNTAMSTMVPALFSGAADPETLAAAQSAASAVERVLGPDATRQLFFTLGPAAGDRSSLPLRARLAEALKGSFTLLASGDCDCNHDQAWFSCGFGEICSELTGCTIDDTWPMCGPEWAYACDGLCSLH
jgi:hypothetical protein